MVYLDDFFWILMAIFAIIGLFRGAAREMLVGIAVLLALFFTSLLESTVSFVGETLAQAGNGMGLFYFRSMILAIMVFFGYQTPYRGRLPLKQKISDNVNVERLLGIFIGAVNGFLIVGTLWYFMHEANYPLEMILPPPTDGERGESIQKMLQSLPPNWLEPPTIYFAIAIGLAVILVMFV